MLGAGWPLARRETTQAEAERRNGRRVQGEGQNSSDFRAALRRQNPAFCLYSTGKLASVIKGRRSQVVVHIGGVSYDVM